MTACTSPRLKPSETPLRISRPSTLTCRSLISKSANVPPVGAGEASLPRDLVGAGRVTCTQPGRSREHRPQHSFVDLLLVPAGMAASRGAVLDGAVAVPQLNPTVGALDHLRHVTLLRCQLRQRTRPFLQVEACQLAVILRFEPARPVSEEALELLSLHEV